MALYPKAVLEYLSLQGIPRSVNSNIYVVDGANGADTNAGDRWTAPLKTVSAAYAKCISGQNDVVLVLSSTAAINEDEAIVWSKNLTHLIGLGAENGIAQRTRIVCNATGLSPFITLSGYGCIWKNVYIWQGQDDVNSLVNVSVTGDRNYFESIHFAGGGHATQAKDGGASLLINGGSENRFVDCTFGVDTVDAATGMAAVVFAAAGGAARNLFRQCRFTLHAGHSGAMFVELLGNGGIDRYQIFENCMFINLSGTAMASGFVVASGFDPANKRVLLKDCALIGAVDWDANDRGILYLNNGTITGGGNAGLFAASAAA